NRNGEPCRSPCVGPSGRCPAHAGTDMRAMGSAAGRRSAEARRLRRRRVEEIVAEQLEAANGVLRSVRDAVEAGDWDAAVRALGAAFGKTPDEVAVTEAHRRMLERRRESLRTGSRWRDEDELYEP